MSKRMQARTRTAVTCRDGCCCSLNLPMSPFFFSLVFKANFGSSSWLNWISLSGVIRTELNPTNPIAVCQVRFRRASKTELAWTNSASGKVSRIRRMASYSVIRYGGSWFRFESLSFMRGTRVLDANPKKSKTLQDDGIGFTATYNCYRG